MKSRKTLLALAASSALAGSLLLSTSVSAAQLLDKAAQHTSQGSSASVMAEGKCGEGKCGKDKGKCGEGKCGGDKKDGDKKDGEGKCGEGKCGGK